MPIAADDTLKEQARSDVRDLLGKCAGFRDMAEKDQLQMYKDLIAARVRELSPPPPRSRAAMATAMVDRASDSIDYNKLENRRIEQAGHLAGDFIQQVQFPKFVREL